MNITLFAGLLIATVIGGTLIARLLERVRRFSRRVVYTIATITATGGGGVASEWTGLTSFTSLFN